MGNSSCCLRNSSSSTGDDKTYTYGGQYTRNNEVEFQYVNQTFPRDETSTNFLPHISEREMQDVKDNRRSCYMLDALAAGGGFPGILPKSLRKSSSCSTIYIDDSTISQPNLKNTIKCISLAIYYHIANRKNRGHERLMEIFEERLHPITREAMPIELVTRDPDHRLIYRFVRTLFHSAQLTAECAIITLVYIERLLNYAEMDLCPSNWRRVVLGAIMLASKVWVLSGCYHDAVEVGIGITGMRYDMHQYIDMDKTCRLRFVDSDCDEELLFNIPFSCHVRITGLAIMGEQDESHPAKIRLFKDRPMMSFDDCSIEPDQEIDLKQDPTGSIDYPLKASKFGSITHLSIHISKNFGGEETRVFYIGLRGEFQHEFRQRVAIATYEARPLMDDHKGEIPDSVICVDRLIEIPDKHGSEDDCDLGGICEDTLSDSLLPAVVSLRSARQLQKLPAGARSYAKYRRRR
uniref:PITH domain-containing protein n=1 Tax=Heterorhabditis bacteriophora TaxID=37862 RepID=A0A1I7XSQ1_HETBA